MSSGSIDRGKLPIRRPPFEGVVKDTLHGTQPDWDHLAPIRAREGAPNVLLVLTDDAGFGNPNGVGGPVRTPTLNRLTDGGLRYNRSLVVHGSTYASTAPCGSWRPSWAPAR